MTEDAKARYVREWSLEHCDTPVYRFTVTRREFGKLGLGLLFTVAPQSEGQSGKAISRLHIAADGAITVMTGKVELGQGVRTIVAQAAAEELRAPISQIRVLMGDTDLTPDDGGTWGSLTSPQTIPVIRAAAAAARESLERLAAAKWGVDRSAVSARDGVVRGPGGQRLAYREIAGDALSRGAADSEAVLTKPAEWKVCGTSVAPLEGIDIVTGARKFAGDSKLEGMRHARVIRPPAYTAVLTSHEAPPAAATVRDGNLLGVIADTEESAARLAKEVKAVWQTETLPDAATLRTRLKEASTPPKPGEGGRYPALVVQGNAVSALADAERKFEAQYRLAYIAHVPLEPRAAIAHWKDNRLTVHSGTQAPFLVRRELAEAFRIPESRIRVVAHDPGSGYGGKQRGECEIEAARLARGSDVPVRLQWTREEEFTASYCRPAGVVDLSAALDSAGRIVAWQHRNYNSGAASLKPPYAIPHFSCEYHRSAAPFRQGSYRSLAGVANTFAREAHVDGLAKLVDADLLEFRLRNLQDERLKHVLERAAERFGWGKRRGSAQGLSCNLEKDARLALFLEMDEDRRRAKVKRMVMAIDPGAVLNPDGLRNQVEGALVQGIGGALFEELTFDSRNITNALLSKYRVPRFSDTPEIEVIVVDRRDIASTGAGEAPITLVAPAIAGAMRGRRPGEFRSLPLSAGV